MRDGDLEPHPLPAVLPVPGVREEVVGALRRQHHGQERLLRLPPAAAVRRDAGAAELVRRGVGRVHHRVARVRLETEVVAEVEGAVGGPGGVVGGGGVRLPVEEPPGAVADGVVGGERRQRRRRVLGRARRGVAGSCGRDDGKDHCYEHHCRIGHGWHQEEWCASC